MSRENDIQELCNKVLKVGLAPDWETDEESCPFCSVRVHGVMDNDIKDLKHNRDCAYLIAKDLTT